MLGHRSDDQSWHRPLVVRGDAWVPTMLIGRGWAELPVASTQGCNGGSTTISEILTSRSDVPGAAGHAQALAFPRYGLCSATPSATCPGVHSGCIRSSIIRRHPHASCAIETRLPLRQLSKLGTALMRIKHVTIAVVFFLVGVGCGGYLFSKSLPRCALAYFWLRRPLLHREGDCRPCDLRSRSSRTVSDTKGRLGVRLLSVHPLPAATSKLTTCYSRSTM